MKGKRLVLTAAGSALVIAGVVVLIILGALRQKGSAGMGLAGTWYGAGWGRVDLQPTPAGGYQGTYSDTYGVDVGKIELAWSSRSNRYEGAWSEGTYRFGDMRLMTNGAGGSVRGLYGASRDCERDPGVPTSEEFEWSRTPPPGPGILRRVWEALAGLLR